MPVRLGDTYRLPFLQWRGGHRFRCRAVPPGAALSGRPRHRGGGSRARDGAGRKIADRRFRLPHNEEFLREEYAHRRLGFSDREVEGWFAAAGLTGAGTETIASKSESEKLTVKLWLATAEAQKPKRSRMSLEKLITDPSPLQVSFGFSPPKTDEAEASLWTAIRRLEPLQPAFVSVTYGAGGSTRERTHATVKRIVEETTLKPAAHLTCVAASKGEIDDIVRAYWDAGIRHIVALRGDMPNMAGGPIAPIPTAIAPRPN